ncbi:hypothetical protein [Rubinisphaera margarita]|uniref:hypothetical protein n=1 Tax=Rubinisphaera margarita TaxID=2909586 RepID=UPI001EE79633|nr:hypothetical protein [Rubinisphaera margarita]MCG6155345.1 hypothetical protein [Rubinisphaera margarita]
MNDEQGLPGPGRYARLRMAGLIVMGALLATGFVIVWKPGSASDSDVPTGENGPTSFDQGEGTLKGVIVREDGSPNTAPLTLYFSSRRVAGPVPGDNLSQAVGTLTSDFEIRAASGEVYLLAMGDEVAPSFYGPFITHPGDEHTDLKLVVSEGNHFEITLVDEAGSPVSEASIVAKPQFKQAWFGISTIDRDLPEVAPGKYLLNHAGEISYEFHIARPGYQPYVDEPKLDSRLTSTLIKLETSNNASGYVVDEQGRPVAGAKLMLTQGISCAMGKWDKSVFEGKVVGITDERGWYSADTLVDDILYVGIVEAPDKRRVVFDNLYAGNNQGRHVLPPLRILHCTLVGDISELQEVARERGRRTDLEVVITQQMPTRREYTVDGEWAKTFVNYRSRDRIRVDVTGAAETFACPGIFADQIMLQIGPDQVTVDGSVLSKSDDIYLTYNLTTARVESLSSSMPDVSE